MEENINIWNIEIDFAQIQNQNVKCIRYTYISLKNDATQFCIQKKKAK